MLALTGTADKDTEKTVIGELLMKNPVKLFMAMCHHKVYFAGAYNTASYAGYLLSYFKTLSFGPAGVELTTPRVTAQCSTTEPPVRGTSERKHGFAATAHQALGRARTDSFDRSISPIKQC